MAHKKAQGSTSNGRDSQAKRLGLKKANGEAILPGQVIIKQRGTKYHPGKNVRKGSDDTLYAATAGVVQFQKKRVSNFAGNLKQRTFVHVVNA